MDGFRAHLRRLRARSGGAAGGADLDRQRLLLHARRGRVGGRRRRALPGHLRARRLQPRDDDPGRAARCSTRTWSTCPTGSCSSCASRARTRSGSTTSSCSTTATSYDIRNALVVARAALPRPRRPGDQPAQPSLRQHGPRSTRRRSSGRSPPENWSGRVEVVSALDGRVTNRGVARYRQLEGRHLDPVSPADVRARGHRAEGADPPVEPLHRPGRPHPRLPRRRAGRRSSAACTRWRTTSSRSSPSTCAQGEPVRVEKMVAFYTSRDRAISEPLASAGESRRPLSRRSPRRSSATRAAWDELWEVCDMRAAAGTSACSSCCASTSPRPAGVLAPHGRPRRRRPGARPQRRGLPRARLLGRALRLSRS